MPESALTNQLWIVPYLLSINQWANCSETSLWMRSSWDIPFRSIQTHYVTPEYALIWGILKKTLIISWSLVGLSFLWRLMLVLSTLTLHLRSWKWGKRCIRESQEIYNEVNRKKSKWRKKQEIVEFKGYILDDPIWKDITIIALNRRVSVRRLSTHHHMLPGRRIHHLL